MSRKDLVKISKSLGIGQPPKTRPKGDEKELPEDVRKFYDSIRKNIHKGEAFDHGLWDEILKECVDEGEIRGIPLNTFDYTKLVKKTEGKEGKLLGDKLDAYLENLGTADLESLSANNQIALLMNAYNALCINIIVKAMRAGKSVNSIRDLGEGDTKVWDINAGKLCGEEITLTSLEHKSLRGVWAEPRLHACIVCASVSCPDLRGEAFRGDDTLADQMDDQMRKWMLNPKKGMNVNGGGKHIALSSIFNWFARDFRPTPIKFLFPYLPEKAQEIVKANRYKMKKDFMEYDWGINMPSKSS
eukprot:jgi/Bigna1/83211/fgenesh1_pg.104_\